MSQPSDLELDKAAGTLRLTPAARQVHLHVLHTFAETGKAPGRGDLERVATVHDADPAAVLAELAEQDVVAFDEHGEIRAAYPFSPTPTAIKVTWTDGPVVFAMCAIDALGTSAMLDRQVVIAGTEPETGRNVTVEVTGNEARWTPDTAVVFAGATGDSCCASVDTTCGTINFFTTADAAEAWAKRHPEVSGVVLDQTTALTNGIAEFGALLQPTDR